MDEIAMEARRFRWQRVRDGLRMGDPNSPDFSTAGLASRVADTSVRLLVLPSDPQGTFLDFTEDLWEWWIAERTDPASGRAGRWSRRERPTVGAMVRFGGTERQWDSYLALHRDGGLEVELGRDGAITRSGEMRYFRLSYIVGQLWSTLALYDEVIERLGLSGPWEVTMALRNTGGAQLSNFARGWAEPGQSSVHETSACDEPNLLLRREISEWPRANAAKEIAFSFGGWIEDAWGYRERRFLARTGPAVGQFDPSAYQRAY